MSNNDIIELHVQRTDTGETMRLKGREAWTLACLMEAGEKGVTPLDRPAPRWSGYVYSLRKRGLVVDTLDERHAGPYPGAHGRYVLQTPLTVLKVIHAEEKGRNGFAEMMKAAYAHVMGHTPDSVS